MKAICTIVSLLIISTANAQFTECSSVPLFYHSDSIVFTEANPQSFGDSMIVFNITNMHPTQGFAYPIAKLVPVTPLPPGMALTPASDGWNVFASAWNSNETMPVGIYYNVTTPIPVNYIVEFELWVSNLLPLISDSCSFDSTFTLNLNPGTAAINIAPNEEKWLVSYNSSLHYLQIISNAGIEFNTHFSLYDVNGKILNAKVEGAGIMDVSSLKPGVYILYIEGRDYFKSHKVILY